MIKHTDGPWLVNGKQSIRGSQGEYIAKANWNNGEANARLIASAPKMLEALRAMITSYQYEASAENPALLMAKAAVFEATGEHHEE